MYKEYPFSLFETSFFSKSHGISLVIITIFSSTLTDLSIDLYLLEVVDENDGFIGSSMNIL